MSETNQGMTRRELLKRGAVVGGTVLWATPVVQTLGMARAYAETPSDNCVASWADSVYSYVQGLTKAGGPIADGRHTAANAVGAPDGKFVSLGYGGEIVVHLAVAYFSGKNGEAVVIETSGGSAPYVREQADVYVSNGATGPFVYAGVASNQNASPNEKKTLIPLDGVPGLPYKVTHIKLVDTTDSTPHDDASDGFDVDAVGIGCL